MIFSVEKKASIRKRKLKILRNEMIKKENLHIDDLIDYNQFLELYSKYGNGLSEEEFGHTFLDLLKTDYYSLKKNRCKILKKEEIDEFEIALIKLQLIKKLGLTKGESVSYAQLEKLYNSITTKLSFILFAEKVLEVSSHSVSCIKYNSSKKATIFNKTNNIYFEDKSIPELQKVVKEQITSKTNKIKELKDSIAQDRNLHIGDKITPSEFYEIYEIYGKFDFLPYDFARFVLGISDGKARGLINEKIDGAQVWNNERIDLGYLLKLREEIISKEKLHINDRIRTYDEFKKLFKKYSGILSETMFAEEILDMSRTSYKNLKYGKTEALILTDIEIPENFWEEIKNEIKKKENVYNGKKITYDEFLELYEKYGFVTWDADFANKVLQMSKAQFNSLKRGEFNTSRIFGKRTLDSRRANYDEDYDEKELKKLRGIVISENKLHIRDSLDGKKFNELYEKYGFGMSPKFFATQILDIKGYRLDVILRDESENTTILSNEKVDKEELKALKGKFLKSGEHCIGDMIDYKEFLRLYEIYGWKLSETQFAEKILFITNTNLQIIREQQESGRKTAIFANLKLSNTYIATLKSKVIRKNLLYYRQNITPEFFRKIYKQIPTILSEADFATKILEVSRQVYYKACVSEDNETFIILQFSGTYQNKFKFLERKNKQLKEMLESGFSYSQICEEVNITLDELKQNVRQLKKQRKFEKLEEKCECIIDDFKETKHSREYIKSYIEKCKDRYKGKLADMPEKTLKCFQSCLEFLDENNMRDRSFFIRACIEKNEFFRANEFITFCMQNPNISTKQKQLLQQMRISIRNALKRDNAINMILEGKVDKDIVNSTDLLEVEVINLRKKLKKSKIK